MTTLHDHKHEFGPREEDLARCVHCGFCLQACPTYVVLGLETESPRGRIALSRAVSEGRIEPTPSVVAHFDLCLQCRACETACPSGVPYGRIIEDTRALVQSRPDKPATQRSAAAIVFVGRSGIYFGVGVRMGWFGGFAWGWHHWHADWRGRRIFYDVRRPRAVGVLGN